MPEIRQKEVRESFSDLPALDSLVEQFKQTKHLLVKWVDEMDRVLRESRTSINEFEEALNILAKRVEEWRSILGKTVEGRERKEEEFLTPIRMLSEEDIEKEEEVEREKVFNSTTNISDEEREDVRGYVLALKHGGWNKDKILEALSKREFNRGKLGWEVLNEITEEVFAQENSD